jgi:hypothetical protein
LPKFDPLEAFDAWELEEKLAHVRRILGPAAAEKAGESNALSHHSEGPLAEGIASLEFSPVPWALTKLAVSAITCGGVLAAWWWMTGRQDLIKPALASLAIGHLAWLGVWCWETNRPTASTGLVPMER